MVARIVFDLADIDAAMDELNERYLAGEAAAYTEVWRTIVDGRRSLNRHEPGVMTQRIAAFVDHRRIPFAAEDFGQTTDKLWELVPDARYRAAAVHALDAHGAVINLVIEGTNVHGNELQWSAIDVITFVSGETRLEVYEENDLDAALARFEELRPRERRLENAASRVDERFWKSFAARDWDATAVMLADNHYSDDRRRVIGAGIREGRDAVIDEMRAVAAEFGLMKTESVVIATRGGHLALRRARYTGRDQRPEAFHIDVLRIVEIDADARIVAHVMFDPDDIDAAFEELDARYLAGEAAPYVRVWQSTIDVLGEANRHEAGPILGSLTYVDHRRVSFGSGDFGRAVEELWALVPDARYRVTEVHALDAHGTVASLVMKGTSTDGGAVELPTVIIALCEDERATHIEAFDPDQRDAALARFQEFSC
jgi:hypothetical protein